MNKYIYIYIYICMYVCVYIYIYIYTHIYTCTNNYIRSERNLRFCRVNSTNTLIAIIYSCMLYTRGYILGHISNMLYSGISMFISQIQL